MFVNPDRPMRATGLPAGRAGAALPHLAGGPRGRLGGGGCGRRRGPDGVRKVPQAGAARLPSPRRPSCSPAMRPGKAASLSFLSPLPPLLSEKPAGTPLRLSEASLCQCTRRGAGPMSELKRKLPLLSLTAFTY